MPKPVYRVHPEPPVTELDRFCDPSSWRVSKRGNFYRRFGDELTVTVFQRAAGAWSYCIHDYSREPEYSSQAYTTRRDATAALAHALRLDLV